MKRTISAVRLLYEEPDSETLKRVLSDMQVYMDAECEAAGLPIRERSHAIKKLKRNGRPVWQVEFTATIDHVC